jgi:hypothetical protein
MKSYRMFAASLAMTAFVTFGSAQAALAGSKAKSSEAYRLTGVIVNVNHDARTLTVKKYGEDRLTVVHVPEGRSVRLSRYGNTASTPDSITFEHARRGYHVSLAVKASDALARAN